VLTKFEEGCRVIDRKQKGYRWRDGPTDQNNCAKQYALSSSKWGIKTIKFYNLDEDDIKMSLYTLHVVMFEI